MGYRRRSDSGLKRPGGGGICFSNRYVLILSLFIVHCIGASSSLQILSVAQKMYSNMVKYEDDTAVIEIPLPSPLSKSTSRDLNVPVVNLSMASAKGVNGFYYPRDPTKIPTGFSLMCNKAGGFAPRPVWDDITNSVTPWFEHDSGCFIYFNCHDRNWYLDNSSGAGMYIAAPESLLLPPTSGWVTLTGRRNGAPKISFL